MGSPNEEALVSSIVDFVSTFLDAVLHDEIGSVAAALTPQSLKRTGLSVFGTSAVGVPLGLAAKPHQVGLTAVEVGDGIAVAEVRGRSEAGDEASACTVLLVGSDTDWLVDDIWPVPADCEFSVDAIMEPTVYFYNGQAHLSVDASANLDPVEVELIRGLQAAELGLHLIEHGITLWRAFKEEATVQGDAAGWAAASHLAVLAIAGIEPEPQRVAVIYSVPVEVVATCFVEMASTLGFDRAEEQPAEPSGPAMSGLVDLSGRPISSSGSGQGGSSGIILPRG